MNQRSFFLCAVLLVCALTANGTKIDEIRGKGSNDDVSVPAPRTYYPLDGSFTNNEEADRAPKAQLHHVHLSSGPYGTRNGAYEFAGQVGSYIEFNNSGGEFDTRHSISLLCWVYPDSIDGPLFNYNKGGPYGVHLWMNGEHQVFARITKYSTHAFNEAIISDEILPLRKWAFVGTTYNSATGVNALFINGKIVKTLNIGANQEISTNDPAIRMGVRDGDRRYFKGKITKMRVYDEALSEDQVQALMDADYNPCDRNPCKHGGECIREHGYSFTCKCKDGYTGKICEKEEDRCESHPCKRGGTCITLPGYEFRCQCPKGYHGAVCESDIDECKVHKGGCQDLCVNTIGSYRCDCSDPELSLAHDHYHCVAVGAEVECRQHDMVIYLPKELLYGLDREHLRLIDINCRATENATHFILETDLTKCGTILKHRKGFVVYSNMVSEIPLKKHQLVTRVRQAMIQFHCYYSDWGVVSSIGIKPTSKKIVFSSKGFGSFTITLDLFRKPKYVHAFSEDDYPVVFYIRERMYFELTVETKDSRLTIFPLDCYATPSQDKNSQPRYDAIVDGCPVDDTLEYHEAANEQSKRFSLEAFQYVGKHPYIFFHCRVKICNLTDPNSRCALGCQKPRRLGRSAQATAETMDDVYSLAQGPLRLDPGKDEPEEAETDNKPQEAALTTGFDVPVVAALALVIGVCVVGMSYMGWKKRHQKAMRQFIPLYEDVQK